MTLDAVTVNKGDELTVALNTTGSSWWSADAFRLTFSPLVIKGDVNEDGNVDISDVVATVNYILGTTPAVFNLTAADVNDDNGVDISDVVGIVNMILGK